MAPSAPRNHRSNAANQNKVLIPKPPPKLVIFPYVPLPAAEELKTMKLSFVLFFLKIYKVLMILHAILCSKGLKSTTDEDIDFQELLQITKDEKRKDPTVFLPHRITSKDLQGCRTTRNDTDHLNLNNIHQDWPSRISSYAILCDSANAPLTATEIRATSTQMNAGNFTGIVEFSFTFDWTYSHDQGFGISLIMYGILLRYLAKVVRAFLIRKLVFRNLTLDLDANLNFIKNKLLRNPNFIDVGGWHRGDPGLFQRLHHTRLTYAHGWFSIAWNSWEAQLQDVIDALHLLKAHTEAAVVQDIFDKLVRYKNEGVLVTSEEFNVMDL
jgi:hypothetical protein